MEHQFKPFDKIIVRDSEEETWMCDFFSHYEKDVTYKYVGISDAHRDCLPYEGNEHLVGTYDNPTPPEPEFKFGDKVQAPRASFVSDPYAIYQGYGSRGGLPQNAFGRWHYGY